MGIENNIICTAPGVTDISHLSFGQYILDNFRTNLDRVLQVSPNLYGISINYNLINIVQSSIFWMYILFRKNIL